MVRDLGVSGLFSFSDDAQAEAAEAAVDILYKAGYDPRGLVSLWEKFEKNPKQSPFERGLIPKLLEATRRAIAGYPPLRNPVIRSKAFLAVHKRIQKL